MCDIISFVKNMQSGKICDRNIRLFYLNKFFVGFRFFIPIWILWGSTFLSLSGQGNLEAVSYGIQILMELPSGAFADLLGRKRSVIIGWVMTIISHVGMGFSGSALMYIFFSVFGGFGNAFISGADTALIYDSLKEAGREKEFAKIQSRGMFLSRISIIVASFLGGMMYKMAHSFPFWAMGLAELIGLVFYGMMYEPKLDSEKFTVKGYIDQLKNGVKEAFKNTHVGLLTVYYSIISGITFSSLYFFNYSYAMDLGLGEVGQSILFGVTGVLKAIIVLVVAKMMDKTGKNKVYIIYPAVMAIVYTGAYWLRGPLPLVVIAITEMIAASRFVVLDQYVNEEFSSKVRATALSFLSMSTSLVYLLILSLGGYVAQARSTSFLYTILGFVTIITVMPITYFVVRTNRLQGNKVAKIQTS